MEFMTGVYLFAALSVLMATGLTWFVAYWANQPGGVIEIGQPRWVMPKSVAGAMQLRRGDKLHWTVQPDGSVRVERKG